MRGISRAVRSCQETLTSAILQRSRRREIAGLEKINATVADVLATEGNEENGPWLWCNTNDAVIGAMAKNNMGSLVLLKPGEQQEHIAGIITERVDMSILQAMQLMTEYHVRHVQVIDEKLVGVISIKDVVRAVGEQQSAELKRFNGYIKGEYC
ncbi:unnamed protein product [Malus baccata var. baccata]